MEGPFAVEHEQVASKKRHPAKALTAAFVRSALKPGKYGDGNGLFLLVQPSGSKSWVQRLIVRGKRRDMGLGSVSLVSLSEAREKALDNRRLARSNGDPLAEKRKVGAMLTFEQAARETHQELMPQWKGPKAGKTFLSSLSIHVFPRFGHMLVSEITSRDIRDGIKSVREETPEVARKLQYRIASVFKWAIANHLRQDNPATTDALALPRTARLKTHRKALPYPEVANCIATVHSSGAWMATKLAIEFLILTASRSNEVREAVWGEIDTKQKVWKLPAARMKMKVEHRVPLCARTLEILEQAATLRGPSNLVFPSLRDKPLSDMTLSKLVKELGYPVDIHGFRTSFRTWAQEQTEFAHEVAEAALAHKIGDAASQAYARSDVFEKRRALMNAWALFLASREESALPA